MKISPLNYSFGYNCRPLNTNHTSKPDNNIQNLSFTSIYADIEDHNAAKYNFFTQLDGNLAEIRKSATRIFRELQCETGLSKLLDPDKKTRINILGCSDGSEAWAYAIMMKEAMGNKAAENVSIKGVDCNPHIIDVAKTGRIICSDIEKKYANQQAGKFGATSPLRGDNWDKYLIKSTRPEGFKKALEEYPVLKYMETDRVSRKTIGSGLDWYEINKEGLPEVSFEAGDMYDYTGATDGAECEVYVIANSSAYLIGNSGDIDRYLKLFRDIKKANEGLDKDIYVVIGDLELKITDTMAERFNVTPDKKKTLNSTISSLGFKKITGNQLKKLGVKDYKEPAAKIYKLSPEA